MCFTCGGVSHDLRSCRTKKHFEKATDSIFENWLKFKAWRNTPKYVKIFLLATHYENEEVIEVDLVDSVKRGVPSHPTSSGTGENLVSFNHAM